MDLDAYLLALMERETWRLDAACFGHPRDWWFPPASKANTTRAYPICESCPVSAPCLESALAMGYSAQFGIYGGKSERERRRLLRQRGQGPEDDGED